MNPVKFLDTKSMYKKIAYLYANNETAEGDIKKMIPFTIAPNIIKYLGKKLNQKGETPAL